MHQTLGQIAIKLLNADPQQTEVLFLEYGLEPILEVMSENALKRNRLIYLLYSFVMPTNNSHLRLLQKTKSFTLSMNENEYFAFISGLLLFEREDFSTEIFDFYLQEASSGINMSSPVTRTKVLSILSSFAKVNPLPSAPVPSQAAAHGWRGVLGAIGSAAYFLLKRPLLHRY